MIKNKKNTNDAIWSPYAEICNKSNPLLNN